STVTLRFSKCEVGQTLRLVFISLRPIRQLADQGDNSKDRYKLCDDFNMNYGLPSWGLVTRI
ncbi:MAG: hypothetical protein P9L89_00625, partial [Candidatus Celaenobacter polaris]|nr:hypothetical protein [Candidatus Celaenobacter polaris]